MWFTGDRRRLSDLGGSCKVFFELSQSIGGFFAVDVYSRKGHAIEEGNHWLDVWELGDHHRVV